MPLSWPYGVTGPVVGQMFHVKHSLWRRWCSRRRRPRPPARLGPHFVRRRASKPARALRSLRRPPHRRHLVCWCVARRGPAAYGHRVRVQPRGALPVLPVLCTLNSGRTIAHVDSASVHGYEVLNQSPYTSIGISIPYGDRNCVIPSNHRQNSDICGAKC